MKGPSAPRWHLKDIFLTGIAILVLVAIVLGLVVAIVFLVGQIKADVWTLATTAGLGGILFLVLKEINRLADGLEGLRADVRGIREDLRQMRVGAAMSAGLSVVAGLTSFALSSVAFSDETTQLVTRRHQHDGECGAGSSACPASGRRPRRPFVHWQVGDVRDKSGPSDSRRPDR